MTLSIPAFCQDLQYPFSFLRLQAASLATAGIVNSGDMLVSPASGLQVQVSSGKAFVQQTAVQVGESAFYKGNYFAFNDAAANPYNTISAPLVNPRVDMVVLRVYDVTEQGLGGSSYQRFEWVQGTETAGANVTPGSGGYFAGIGVVPANSLVLAYVLQTVGEVSISSGNILQDGGPHAWHPLISLVNCSPLSGAFIPSARIIGDNVQLRGALGSLSAPNPGFTLPSAAMYPVSNVYLDSNGDGLQITPSGVGVISGGSSAFYLDGKMFSRS